MAAVLVRACGPAAGDWAADVEAAGDWVGPAVDGDADGETEVLCEPDGDGDGLGDELGLVEELLGVGVGEPDGLAGEDDEWPDGLDEQVGEDEPGPVAEEPPWPVP